jgi:8-oxo-dGTP diphosphatase
MTDRPRSYPERPLIGVSVAVRRNGDVLLVRRARPPFEGLWSFPGGLVETGERLAEAAAREVREETALAVEVGERIDLAEIIGHDLSGRVDRHYVLIVFAGSYRSGAIAACDDAAEARWFDRAGLAGIELTPDTARILARAG